jgi:hypothetical protein
MTGKDKLLIGFAFLTPLLSASYFYTEIKRHPASETRICNNSAYEQEKRDVIRLVKERIDAIKAGDNLALLLPVEFIFTTGNRDDPHSHSSHLKSILRINDDGETIIQTSDAGQSYLTDHRQARRDFLTGKRKYFSLVEVKAFTKSPADTHFKHVLYDYVSHFEATGELNVADLILADIRNPIAPSLKNVPFIKILKQKNEMVSIFSRDRVIAGMSYNAYEGMPRMVDRFECESILSILTTSFRMTKTRELHAEMLNEP